MIIIYLISTKMESNEGNDNNSRINEVYTGHKGVPIDIIIKVRNSICKIIIKRNNGNNYGTGFF